MRFAKVWQRLLGRRAHGDQGRCLRLRRGRDRRPRPGLARERRDDAVDVIDAARGRTAGRAPAISGPSRNVRPRTAHPGGIPQRRLVDTAWHQDGTSSCGSTARYRLAGPEPRPELRQRRTPHTERVAGVGPTLGASVLGDRRGSTVRRDERIQRGSDQVRRLLVSGRHPGGVGAEGDARVGVTEAAGDCPHVDAAGDELGGDEVPEVV